MKILPPIHTSFETAFIVESYPYGFREKTEARFWIETNKKGQRVIFQTLNPKTQKYNKPKLGNYYLVSVLFLDDNNHVCNDGMSEYNTSESGNFLEKYSGGFLPYYEGKLWIFKALFTAQEITGKKIYNGQSLEVWAKAKELLNDWGKPELIEKIRN